MRKKKPFNKNAVRRPIIGHGRSDIEREPVGPLRFCKYSIGERFLKKKPVFVILDSERGEPTELIVSVFFFLFFMTRDSFFS